MSQAHVTGTCHWLMSRAHVMGLCHGLMSWPHIIGSCHRLMSRALHGIYSHPAMYSHSPPFLPCLPLGLYHPAHNCIYHEVSVTGSCLCCSLEFYSQVQSRVLVTSSCHRCMSWVHVTGERHWYLLLLLPPISNPHLLLRPSNNPHPSNTQYHNPYPPLSPTTPHSTPPIPLPESLRPPITA